MSEYTFKQHLLMSLCCCIAFALILACNGTTTVLTTPTLGKTSASLSTSLALGRFSHLITAGGNAPVLASILQASPTPSDVPESFQSSCNFSPGFFASLKPGQIVAVVGILNEFPSNTCNAAFSVPQPPQVFWTSHSANGSANYDVQPVFHSGTIQSLVVTALTSSSQEMQCADLADTASVADGDVVVAYLNPQTNTVTLYNDTSALSLSCQINGFPVGDTYLLLTVRFAKL